MRNFTIVKSNLFLPIVILFLIVSCKEKAKTPSQLNNPQIQTPDFDLNPETAHPKAKKLFNEDFYWSPIDEFAPFGSDDGSDAFYGFREWRLKNPNVTPTVYLKQLNEEWGYQSQKATIAVGFGQFALEGKIDSDIKTLTNDALKKQLNPILMLMLDGDDKKFLTDRISKMIATLDKMEVSKD